MLGGVGGKGTVSEGLCYLAASLTDGPLIVDDEEVKKVSASICGVFEIGFIAADVMEYIPFLGAVVSPHYFAFVWLD